MPDAKKLGAKRWWAVAAISLSIIAFSLDLTVLNLALPELGKALHASTNQLQWIVDAYSLVLAVLTLPAGMLGDRFGRKKFMIIALLIFGVSSALCAYSTSVGMLITARLILGVGASFVLPLGLSVVPVLFSPSERLRAMAIMMGGSFLAYPLGPILGGWLLTHFWWGSVFLINVPVVLVALLAVVFLLPESSSREHFKLDYTGILFSSLGLTGITYGAIQAETKGWGDHIVLASFAAGIILLIVFALWESRVMRRKLRPLVNLRLFDSRGFTWGTILMTSVSFALFGLLFSLPQYLQSVRGQSALGAGYHLMPMIGGLLIGTVLAVRLSKRIGNKVSVGIGYGIMAIGLILGTLTTINTSNIFLIFWCAVIGLGLGFALPTTSNAAIGSLTPERSGSGTATISAVRQVGGTLGVAVLGTILGSVYRSHLHIAGLPAQAAAAVRGSVTSGTVVAAQLHSNQLLSEVHHAFIHSMDTMLWVCAGIAIVALVLALVFLPNKGTADPDEKMAVTV